MNDYQCTSQIIQGSPPSLGSFDGHIRYVTSQAICVLMPVYFLTQFTRVASFAGRSPDTVGGCVGR